jgi:hypothetical protein
MIEVSCTAVYNERTGTLSYSNDGGSVWWK